MKSKFSGYVIDASHQDACDPYDGTLHLYMTVDADIDLDWLNEMERRQVDVTITEKDQQPDAEHEKLVHIGNGWSVDDSGNVSCDDEPVPADELVRLLEREQVAHKYLVERMAKAEGQLDICNAIKSVYREELESANRRITELEAERDSETRWAHHYNQENMKLQQRIAELEAKLSAIKAVME